ncbi:ESYT3 [Symbiodinium sp. KB8]|nr:ESYT3 [Symbiodinium sp. KB8]
MGQCGCSRNDAAPMRRSSRKEDNVESALLNESRRFILERTKAKRGPQGVELGWLNFMVQKLWPKLSKACTAIIKEELQPKLQAAVPAVLSGIYFKKLDFGNQHPLLGPVGVAHGKQNQYDGLELDVKLVWKCDAEVVLEVQGIEIGLEKIRIDGTVRLQLRPLLHHFPCMGGLQITMMSPPNLNWNFRGLLGALQLDVLSRVMRQVVADQISELLVVPNLLFLHWMDSSADVDLEVLQFPHPECIVRLCVREARNLRGSDWNYFGFKGTSDPYVSVHLGSRLWHTPKKSRTRNPRWGDAGCEDFFVYTPSQFVKVDVYDADIGPGTDDHLGHVAGLKVEDLLNSPSQWWPLSGRKVRDAQPEPGTASQDTSQDHSHPHGEVYIQARFYDLRTHRQDVPKPMGKAAAEAFVFIDLRSLRGLQQKQAQGATITFKLEGNTHKSRGATYKATTYGSALTASAQRLVEHLQNSQGKSIEEIMKISGLSKEQVASVVQARPSFTTRWHQPFSFPIRDLDTAQLEISLGIRRPYQKSLAQLKSPICLKDLVDSGKWQLDKALVLDLDGKEGASVVLETLELSLRITLRTSPLSKNPDWPDGEAPAGWASIDLREVVLREEHLRLTAEARIETACCTEHALASQLSEMKNLFCRIPCGPSILFEAFGSFSLQCPRVFHCDAARTTCRSPAARRIGVSAATPFAKFNARTFAAQVTSPRPLSIRGDGLVLQCITAALIYFVPQDAVFLGGLFYLWHNTAVSISPKVTKADADAAVEEFKAKKGIENVKVSKAAAKFSLARAANWKDEALRNLSKIEKHRREEVKDLLEAETMLRRQMQDAEDSSDKCLAELRSEHAHAERRVAREFEECDAALLLRSKAAEELLAAADKERSLTRTCALHGLRGEALEARLHVSRQLMVEACQAHEAADRREAVAALARSEARGAEELAVQQAASQGLMESQFLRQSAAERAQQLEVQEATVKARADKAVALVEGEVEALKQGALQQCAASEQQAEEFIESARRGLVRQSAIREKAEARAADAWNSEEANIRSMREEQNLEVQEALESAAAAAAVGEELATELGEELRTRLRSIRSEEKQVQHECEKAIEAVQGKGTCQEEEDVHRLRSTECSESELLAERLHIEEEVLSFEVTEEEAASMLRHHLDLQISEAAERCKELAKNTSGALQQLCELTQHAEQSARQAQEAAEQDEKMHRCAVQQYEASAEASEKLQQLRSLALHEEVLAAKLNAELSMAHDERLAGEEEEAALSEEDRCIRACCEEIAAARYEAETVISSWRAEDAVLEVDAQELLDKAAALQVESRMLEESRCSEEETCQELVIAADEVRAAARAAVHGYEAREAIAQRTAHELQEEAKQKQEARSVDAGHRFNSAELRAEAAARRALEAEESSWIARERYEQELASMREYGETEEAETIRRVLAAEEALANSMRWSGQHNQLGLELFGVAQAQKGIHRTSPASTADGAPPDLAEAEVG